MLPGEVNSDGVSANLSDGVLSVKIPKAEEAKPHRIEVGGLTGSPSWSGPGELRGIAGAAPPLVTTVRSAA